MQVVGPFAGFARIEFGICLREEADADAAREFAEWNDSDDGQEFKALAELRTSLASLFNRLSGEVSTRSHIQKTHGRAEAGGSAKPFSKSPAAGAAFVSLTPAGPANNASSRAARMAIMAMTTSNSMRVNPRGVRAGRVVRMASGFGEAEE